MNVKNWLEKTENTLLDTSETPRLDAEVLLADVLDKDKSWLYAHPEQEIEATILKKLKLQLKRRVLHEPLAYIRGKSEFYGRKFLVDKRALVPRPESETMIDLLKQLVGDRRSKIGERVIDLGTGSGVLAITTKLELQNAKVTAIDIDPQCIKLARKNAQKHKVDIELLDGDLLSPISDIRYPISENLAILANLPYIPTDYPINQAATHEPKLAIFGGSDGLVLYRKLFSQISDLKSKISFVFTEALPDQHQKLKEIAELAGFIQIDCRGFIQVFEKP